ncbi:MAG TPA: hypothetical protein PLX13_12795, partial [Saprospiraceae bacterium]|nr:hypothetical protein [Saprospiraceae bacterium]
QTYGRKSYGLFHPAIIGRQIHRLTHVFQDLSPPTHLDNYGISSGKSTTVALRKRNPENSPS